MFLVVSRGRNYNTFLVVPQEDSGVGKFRQLIAHLVQRSAVAVVNLRHGSCLYLLPSCDLSKNRMGLEVPGSIKNYLHAIVVTPKILYTKITGKVYGKISCVLLCLMVCWKCACEAYDHEHGRFKQVSFL